MATGVGIDVGHSHVKIVMASVSKNQVVVTGALKIPRPVQSEPNLPIGMPDLPDHLKDTSKKDEKKDEKINTLDLPPGLGEELKRARLRSSGTLGITGREVMMKYLSTPPMPREKIKMFLDMELGGRMGRGPSSTQDAGQAVTYDFRILNTPSGLQGDLILMCGVSKNDFLMEAHTLYKKNGLYVQNITPSCFGLVNAFLRTQRPAETEVTVVVDVGHEMLEIAIFEGSNLYFARSAPGGGKKFEAGLEKALKCGTAQAREFKHTRAKLYPEGTQIANKEELAFQSALKEGAENIAGAIRSSIMFCRTQAKLPKLDFHKVVLTGGGARLAGLREYLEKKTGKPVQILDLSSGIDLRRLDAASAQCFDNPVSDMSVALGLAIIDADAESFHHSLLPDPIVQRQAFFRKTLFGIAAGAALVASTVIPYQNSSNAVQESEERIGFYNSQTDTARASKKAFEKLVAANDQHRKTVDYYARQTRLGRSYLDLFVTIRDVLPDGIELTYLGPEADRSGIAGKRTDESAIRTLSVHGHYNTDLYPDAEGKFGSTWEEIRRKLLAVPGVKDAVREEKTTEEEKMVKPKFKSFQIRIDLTSEEIPVLGTKTAAVAPGQPSRLGTGAQP